jgi:DNA-binding NarL/FixJ family response regulator
MIRVLLADDHTLVRRGLRMILEAERDMAVVAEAGTGAEAVQQAGEGVDLAVLDVSMPVMTGLQAAAELGRRHPGVKSILLTMHSNEQYLCEAVQAGASGYVLKDAVDEELVDACRAATRGAPFVFPRTSPEGMRERVAAAAADGGSTGPLTEREREVLKLIAEGYTGQQIAAMLVISEKTVERHRSNLLQKLALRDRVDLTRYAIRVGLVEA